MQKLKHSLCSDHGDRTHFELASTFSTICFCYIHQVCAAEIFHLLLNVGPIFHLAQVVFLPLEMHFDSFRIPQALWVRFPQSRDSLDNNGAFIWQLK